MSAASGSNFAIGDQKWPGVSKLIEEMGELNQVLGKLMGSRGSLVHWSGDLGQMLHEELADVLAAIDFVATHGRLDMDQIRARTKAKRELFETWHVKEAP